jgi:bifunctional enzyme CysN/CysC
VGITLDEQLFVERGQIAVAVDSRGLLTQEFSASVFWMGQRPLIPGRSYRLKLMTQEVDCTVAAISKVINAATLEGLARPEVGRYEVAELTLRTRVPVVADLYQELPISGRFVLVDELEVAGGGTISAVVPLVPAATAGLPAGPLPPIRPADRAARNGHPGRIVYVVAAEPEQRAQAAAALEQELFARGAQAFLLGEGGTWPKAGPGLLAAAGLLAIVPTARAPKGAAAVVRAEATMQRAADALLERE